MNSLENIAPVRKHPVIQTIAVLASIVVPALSAIASQPLISIVAMVPAPATLESNGTAWAQYRVTGQSAKTHIWAMQPIQGITQVSSDAGACANPFVLAPQNSCLLKLQLDGSQMGIGVHGGPVICVQNTSLQCYQPGISEKLNVTIVDDWIFKDGFESPP